MKLSEVAGPDPAAKPMKLSDLTKDSGEEAPNPYTVMAAGGGDPNITPSDIGEIGKGAVAAIPGLPGDIESLARTGINKIGGDVDEETALPTSTEVGTALFGSPDDERAHGYRTLGEAISPGFFKPAQELARGAKALTAGAQAAKLGEEVASGELGKSVLSVPRAAAAARKEAADAAYAEADSAMATKHASEPWQEHPSGRAFLTELENRISTEGSTTETAATRSDLRRIHDDLQGAKDASGGTAYSTPNVLRETLRKLRDRASGVPETGFDAIDQQRAGDLADDLAKSIADWEPSLAKADTQYREMSKVLYPQGVEPGKFAKEMKRAETAVNTLEKQVKDGTVDKDMVAQVRSLIKNESVTRLADTKTLKDLNKRLDKIEAAAARGKLYKRGAAGAAALLGLGYAGRGIFH